MEIELSLDTKKVQKALKASEKQMATLFKRAGNRTAQNVRAIASKKDMGIEGLRRKKVPRSRVKALRGNKIGIWFGLNDIRASEFKERPIKVEKGVKFQGKLYSGFWLGRFKNDPLPRSKKRILIRDGKSWKEAHVAIDKVATEFIEREIVPQVGKLFDKNFNSAVDGAATIRWK